MKKVVLTHINSIHYDPKTKVLEITFNSGSTYSYHNVNESDYNALEQADSHGKHFDKHIKNKYITVKK